MERPFFTNPILNSPYECPSRHWELDASGQPTGQVLSERRHVTLITPIPKPKTKSKQDVLTFDRTAAELETKNQQYEVAQTISGLRSRVSEWRTLQMDQWRVTPETARLLDHWRNHRFSGIRPFFCQIEAVETVIWLTEVAPQARRRGRRYLDHLDQVNGENYESLSRLALKLATGTGKTTIMAMLIAWQTINAVRRPNSQRFTRGFLIPRERRRVMRAFIFVLFATIAAFGAERPYLAAIATESEGRMCGSTVIAEGWALTAWHCVTAESESYFLEFEACPGVSAPVLSIHAHPRATPFVDSLESLSHPDGQRDLALLTYDPDICEAPSLRMHNGRFPADALGYETCGVASGEWRCQPISEPHQMNAGVVDSVGWSPAFIEPGDSGGPVLVRTAEGVRLVMVNRSRWRHFLQWRGVFTQLDVEWIRRTLGLRLPELYRRLRALEARP